MYALVLLCLSAVQVIAPYVDFPGNSALGTGTVYPDMPKNVAVHGDSDRVASMEPIEEYESPSIANAAVQINSVHRKTDVTTDDCGLFRFERRIAVRDNIFAIYDTLFNMRETYRYDAEANEITVAKLGDQLRLISDIEKDFNWAYEAEENETLQLATLFEQVKDMEATFAQLNPETYGDSLEKVATELADLESNIDCKSAPMFSYDKLTSRKLWTAGVTAAGVTAGVTAAGVVAAKMTSGRQHNGYVTV